MDPTKMTTQTARKIHTTLRTTSATLRVSLMTSRMMTTMATLLASLVVVPRMTLALTTTSTPGGREPDDFDGGDESRKAFSKLPTSIPDERLFSPHATVVDVLEDVGCLIPALSPTRPDIAALIKDLQRGKAVQYRPVFSVHMHNSTAWSVPPRH
jgi:hypothetical protein